MVCWWVTFISVVTMSESLKINNIDIKQENCLDATFFNKPCIELANALLGKYLVRKLSSGELLVGRIVETESYGGVEDRASHSYNNKRTARNEPMFMAYGTIYVYFTYGMYYCFNISSKEPGSAVLIRALEPVHGLDIMLKLRNNFNTNRLKKTDPSQNITDSQTIGCSSNGSKPKDSDQIGITEEKTRLKGKKRLLKESDCVKTNKKKHIKNEDLCNGPSKLCISMDLSINTVNKLHISENERLWVQDLDERSYTVVSSTRIGIGDFAKDWKDKLLRFYILVNQCVSRTDKMRESKLV